MQKEQGMEPLQDDESLWNDLAPSVVAKKEPPRLPSMLGHQDSPGGSPAPEPKRGANLARPPPAPPVLRSRLVDGVAPHLHARSESVKYWRQTVEKRRTWAEQQLHAELEGETACRLC